MTKFFFTDDIEGSSKNLWRMISADVKTNKNNSLTPMWCYKQNIYDMQQKFENFCKIFVVDAG